MKKKLLAGVLVSSALVLGACSEEAQGNDEREQQEQVSAEEGNKKANKADDLVVVTESGEVELAAKPVDEKFAKAVYLPEDFNFTSRNDDEIVARGSDEFEGISVGLEKDQVRGNLEYDKGLFRRELERVPGEIEELDGEKYALLTENYDHGLKAVTHFGTNYRVLKIIGEDKYTYNVILEDGHDYENFEELAVKILGNIEFVESAE